MYQTNYIQNWEDVAKHVLSKYPEESGGIVTSDNIFHPIENISETPLEAYEFRPDELIGVNVKCILHSHPYNQHNPPEYDPRSPSKTDLEGQIATDVEWAIVVTEGENVTQPIFWGDYDHRPDLWDREFIHSIQDCLAFMADWQYKEYGLKLPMHPRDADWFTKGETHVEDVWRPWGFVDVSDKPPAKGDVLFYRIESNVANHVGVVIDANTVAHQLYGRFPKSEPMEKWARYVTRRVRHKTNPAYSNAT